jgi:hypothetical protein
VKNACKILTGNPEGGMPLEGTRRGVEYNIKMSLKINGV